MFEQACHEWKSIVGDPYVDLSDPALKRASTATFPTQTKVTAIVSPANTEEVAACLRIAQKHGVRVYPVSTGKNWGYGSRVPPAEDTAILSLHRMTGILDYDGEMGTVTVEPGVTFRQLAEKLAQEGDRFFMAAPGTTPDASVIGNALERGWGFGPYSDRAAAMCGLEVVLPDGAVVETGMARFPGAASSNVYRWGLGPCFDGMFSQSNLGVVTRATIFLAPSPSNFVAFVYHWDDPARLPGVVDALRDLKLKQIIRTNFKLQNFYRQLMAKGQFPPVNGSFTLSPAEEEARRKKEGIGVWNGAGALYCWSEEQAEAEKKIVRQALERHVDAILFLDKGVEARAAELAPQVEKETGYHLDSALKRYFHDTRFIGVERGNKGMQMAYWRKPTAAPEDPDLDRDRVGFVWIDPLLPFRGRQVLEAIEIIDRTQREFGFEPNIGLNCVTERAITATGAIVYDRDDQVRDDKALACARAAVERLADKGYILGRLTIDSMDLLQRAQPGSRTLQDRVKQALDPNRILAPGRYE